MKRTHRALGISLLAAAWVGLTTLETPGRLPQALAQDRDAVAAAESSREPGCPRGLDPELMSEWHVGAYRVTVRTCGVDQVLTFERGGVAVSSQRGQSFRLPSVREGGRLHPLTPGRDLTGNGRPNVAISEQTGGAHCSNRVWVFELGDTLQRYPPIDAAHEGVAFFEDVNGDGRLEFRTHDWTFANWRTAFAFSPAPEVVLSVRAGALRPNWSLMTAPDQLIETQVTEVQAEQGWTEGEVPPTLWGYMLDWIYGGRPERAWSLLARAWPAETPGRDAFERAFRAQLTKSPYWTDLAPRLK